jgi:hypothetical protein
MKIRVQAGKWGTQRSHGPANGMSLRKEQGYWGSRLSRMQRRLMMGTRGRGRGA